MLSHVLAYGAIRREMLASVLTELGGDVPDTADPILWEQQRARERARERARGGRTEADSGPMRICCRIGGKSASVAAPSPGRPAQPPAAARSALNERSRSELVSTKTLESAIAAPAKTGFSRPATATGISTTL